MPKLDFENKHQTRSKGGYIPFKNLGFKFKNSFSPTQLVCGIRCQNKQNVKIYLNLKRLQMNNSNQLDINILPGETDLQTPS